MFTSTKRVACVLTLALFALGLGRAALSRYQEKEQAIRAACRDQMQKSGLTPAAAKARYPTPEISMASIGCLLPGETAEVVLRGKFAPGTQFVFENDNLEVVKESLTGGEYRATLKAAPGLGPETAAVTAITPVSGISTRMDPAVGIGGRYEWTMNAANGWKVVARSAGNPVCGSGPSSSGGAYELTFFHKDEAAPFEKRNATLHFSLYDQNNYSFSIDSQNTMGGLPGGDPQQMQALVQKMMDPNLSIEQREQLMQRMAKMQEQVQANMQKMLDPANMKKMQEAQLQFGCQRIQLQMQGGGLTGEMRCAEAVGTRLGLTGTVKFLGR